jgi:hypothetical protein
MFEIELEWMWKETPWDNLMYCPVIGNIKKYLSKATVNLSWPRYNPETS